MRSPTVSRIAASILALTWSGVTAAHAAEAEEPQSATTTEPGYQDIIVTAQRREERLQDVPIAVNVISGSQITSSGITDTMQIAMLVPAMDFQSIGGTASAIYLRGVGSNDGNPNAEPSVATYVDGVYVASNQGNVLDLNNIERVEVLKGPQGTLFGRNATGGVIQVITKDPQQDPTVNATVGYGNYNTWEAGIYAATGLTDNIAVDISGQFRDQNDGFGTNLLTGGEARLSKSYSIRSKVVGNFGDTTVRLSGDYRNLKSDGPMYIVPLTATGVLAPANKYDARALINIVDPITGKTVYKGTGVGNSESGGASLNIEHDFGTVTLRSISAWRYQKGVYALDEDGDVGQFVDAYLPQKTENISQELQAFFKLGGADITLGAFYFDAKAKYGDNAYLAGAFIGPTTKFDRTQQDTKSWSLYGQTSIPLGVNTKLTAGLRYTDEDAKYNITINGTPIPPALSQRGFKKFTWRAALDHAFSRNVHAYASYNRGVKGGGFDLLTPSSPGFNPEILDAFELGIKTSSNVTRFNVAGFYYKYKDIQVQVIPAGSVVTNNAAGAEIYGIDADFAIKPVENLTINGGFAWLHGRYTDFKNAAIYGPTIFTPPPSPVIDASGNETIRTPKISFNIGANYDIPTNVGTFTLAGVISYNDGYSFEAAERLRQPNYTLINSSAGWRSTNDKFGITVWANNLLNEYYYNQGVPTGLGDLLTPAAPRTYGIRLSAKY